MPFLAPPGPPVPRVTDTSTTTIELEWEPPAYNGGGEIIGYFVDKQLVGTNEWSRCTEKMIKVRQYTVREIREGADYKLRVSAVNIAGEGPPGETEPVTVAEPRGNNTSSVELIFFPCGWVKFLSFHLASCVIAVFQQSLHMWNWIFLSRLESR